MAYSKQPEKNKEAEADPSQDMPQASTDVPQEQNENIPEVQSNESEATPEVEAEKWETPAPHLVGHDPLLGCLMILTRLEHNPFSPEALIAGLPLVENKLTPELFIRASERAGLSSQIINRPVEDISSLVLPCVLLLKGKQACVLVAKNDNKKLVKIIQPESKQGETTLSFEKINREYTGYAIFTRPSFRFDKRTDEGFKERPKNWFWSVIAKTWKLYSEVLVASFFINIFAIASSLFVMNVYDRVVPNNATDTLTVLAIGILVVFCFDFLMKMLRGYFIDIAAKKTDVLISSNIFEQMMGVRMESRPESVGNFANNMQQFESFRDFFTSTTISALIDLPFVFFFLIIIYTIGGYVAIVPLLAVPIVIGMGLLIQGPLNKIVKESYRYSGQKHAMLFESLAGVETVKSMSAEGVLQRKWEHAVGMSAKLGTKIRSLSLTAVSFSAWAQQVAGVLVVIVGVYRISAGEMTMGALIACTILTGRALAPLAQVAGLLTRYHQSMAALQSLDNVMKMPTERIKGKTPLHRPVLTGDIEFKHVAFNYPKQDVPALHDASFSITAGEKVGIIGRIGSGKTTIEKLILGLYQSTAGSILLDGTEIGQLDPASVRRNIGYVPQDIVLFYGSVKDNITFSTPFADDTSILRAAKIAGVTEFVAKHPQGFDMPVGERGEKLSGGQRQAIAIARALILDPPILVLDEPTNMMDNRTEELFKQQIQEVSKNKTMILVTHKGSLLSLVDRLILMDNGRIIADGPRDLVLKALAEGKLHSPSR
ncbi:type I secretion system permease/ATPase [Candidatus Berkiella cookevillensis]|uniref:Toxin RTX-I translocation ATP-binding protein n=2 Tax=Candidatus Berkiella cookevillensis TaxID=437022 RepID=A0A0Q9YL17_9GAMM|nr:type I secretion system permease/ATPase [Candidatus Berkiella cookevillensis]